jgi:hypothetical protein
MREYGIDIDDFERMLAEQNGACAICLAVSTDEGKGFDVDHDHATGKVRALLCGSCNRGLGQFKDNAYLVGQAAEYLLSHR